MTDLDDLFRIFPDLPWPGISHRTNTEQQAHIRRQIAQSRQRAERSRAQHRLIVDRRRSHLVARRVSDLRDIARRIVRMDNLIDELSRAKRDRRTVRAAADQLRRELRALSASLKP